MMRRVVLSLHLIRSSRQFAAFEESRIASNEVLSLAHCRSDVLMAAKEVVIVGTDPQWLEKSLGRRDSVLWVGHTQNHACLGM